MQSNSIPNMANTRRMPESTPLDVAPALSPAWAGLLPNNSVQTLYSHPLLCAMRSGAADLRMVQELMIQHHFYSRNFTRFLCLVITNLPEIEDVRTLMRNLLEELGVDDRLGETHAELFLLAMRTVGATTQGKSPLNGTQQLISAMFDHCRDAVPLNGLSAMCMGAEAIVPLIYSPVIAAMRHLELPSASRHFFELHVAEDEDHAVAMLQIIMRMIRDDDAKAARAREVAKDMIEHRIRFLDDIWAAATTSADISHQDKRHP